MNMSKMNKFCYMKNILEKNIVIVEFVDVKSVVVFLVFCKGFEDFDYNLIEVVREMKKGRICGFLLRGCIVMQGCLIQFKEFRNNQGLFKGVEKILIFFIEFSIQFLEDNSVKVIDIIKIIVQLVRRGSEFESKNSEILVGFDDIAKEF